MDDIIVCGNYLGVPSQNLDSSRNAGHLWPGPLMFGRTEQEKGISPVLKAATNAAIIPGAASVEDIHTFCRLECRLNRG